MDAFSASYAGLSEPDGFNALVMGADLDWRDVSLLRAVGRYLRQVGVTYSQTYIAQALSANVDIARQLVRLFQTRFDPELPLDQAARAARADELTTSDQDGAQRRGQPRPRPDHPVVPRRDLRRGADQLLRLGPAGHRAQAAAAPDPGAARAASGVRDLRLLAAAGGRAPAVRPGRPRRAALVGPGRGLPDRDPRPGQGPDGEEHRDRAGRRQGRLLLQAAARSQRRPRRLAGRGRGLLPAVHHQPARRHRQHRRRRGRPADRRDPLRRRRPLPGGGGGQGHRHLLRHRQPDLGRRGLLAGRRVRLRRLGRLRPQGHGHHRPRRLGVGAAALPGDGDEPPDHRLHLRRHRRHERRRVRQRHAAEQAHQAGRGVRPSARLHRSRSRPRAQLGRAGPAVRAAPVQLGRLRHHPDLRRRRGVPADAEVDARSPSRCGPRWAWPRRSRR